MAKTAVTIAPAARCRACAQSITDYLQASAYDDMAGTGPFGAGGTASAPAAGLIGGLDVQRQAAGPVTRTVAPDGYLTREVSPEDRERITISLAPAGRTAGAAVSAGITTIDRQLTARSSYGERAWFRAAFVVVAQISQGRRAGRPGAR